MVFLHAVAVEINFTIDNSPPAIYIFCYSGVTKVYFSSSDVPPAVFVFLYAIAVEIYLTVNDSPPAVCIFCYSCVIKVYFSSSDVPPAVFVLLDTVAAEVYLTVDHSPPAVFVFRYGSYSCCNLVIFVVIPVSVCIFLIRKSVFVYRLRIWGWFCFLISILCSCKHFIQRCHCFFLCPCCFLRRCCCIDCFLCCCYC